MLKRERPQPTWNSLDQLFWTTLRRSWSRWRDVLVIVKPKTVVGWHRAGFRLYWPWRSRPRDGRPKITDAIRVLVRRLAEGNPDWGAPKIHGELQKFVLFVSERSVARYLRRIRRRGDPGKGWLAFLQKHHEGIVAFDFFTVPAVTFQLLYCSFVIEHGRLKILHFNGVTRMSLTVFETRGIPATGREWIITAIEAGAKNALRPFEAWADGRWPRQRPRGHHGQAGLRAARVLFAVDDSEAEITERVRRTMEE